jgi:hypothetical protein
MTSATTVDRSEFRHVLFSGTIAGAVTAAAVIIYLVISRLLPAGIIEALLETIIVIAAAVAATFLPAFFATSRTVQGVASAAAIGLWGTIVFMAIDIILLRPFKAYPWTWDAVGGGSTWWYLPIWWMLGTFLAWMGAIVTAGRVARGGDASIRSLAIPVVAGAVAVGLGLDVGGVLYMPVAAGAGFVVTLIVFAVLVLARKG